MSYHIYTTDGIILKRTPFGEANILLHILTEDFGLIITSARSARLYLSKLRSALQEYVYISVSCVKSKNGWKVTNVREKDSFFFGYPDFSHRVISQISFVLMKMITGESPNKELFQIVKSGFQFLKNIPEKDIKSFETLMILRILFELGYVAKNIEVERFLINGIEWNFEILKEVDLNKIVLVNLINKGLKESHL